MTAAGRRGAFAGAVLCGGASRRMGRDKALIEIDGSPMAARVLQALRRAGADPIVALGGDEPALSKLGFTILTDDDPGQGPLAAIAGALRHARSPVLLVVPCDLLAPDPTAMWRVVEALQNAPGADVAVPLVDGREQWAHAAWSAAAVPALDAALATGERSIHRAAARLHVVAVDDVDPAALADADEPADLPSGRSPGEVVEGG